MGPSPEEIRAELDRVLGAEALVGATRLSRLLKYTVERTLAGEGNQLKEYVLGVEVFDRPPSYDPRLDSIVRVEARRLRAKLEEYYQGPGAASPLVISIPRGSYVPVFSAPPLQPVDGQENEVDGSHAEANGGLAIESRRGGVPWIVGAGLATSLLILVLAFTSRSESTSPEAAQASSGPSIAILPFQPYSTNESEVLLAARITDGVTAELAKLGTVAVASRTSASRYTGDHAVREAAAQLNVAFVMEASAISAPEGVHVQARVVDTARDRKVWVSEYDSRAEDIPQLMRRIAQDTSAALLKLSNQRQAP
jgi:TolB-like protein